MPIKNDKTLRILTDLWKATSDASITVNNYNTKFTKSHFERLLTHYKQSIIPQDFVIIESGLFTTLEKRERDTVCRIIAELKFNNALWYFDHRLNTKDAEAISALREKNILFKTDTTRVHLVNPLKIRRGKPENVVVATTLLVDNAAEISSELIRDLTPPNQAKINAFYDLLGD
ncbi:MAG: hypothetical protein JST87_16520 [Bacteroidetes bacterium]|nr:hypothetical protein [Bacteroidota bacterium]